MNIIFQENLNEMIHHAQQISTTFCQAPHGAEQLQDGGSALEPHSHLGSGLWRKSRADR